MNAAIRPPEGKPRGGGFVIEPRTSRRSFAYRRAVSLFKGVLDKLSLREISRIIHALTITITEWDPAPLYHFLSMNEPEAGFAGVEVRPYEIAAKAFPGAEVRLLPKPTQQCELYPPLLTREGCEKALTLTDLSNLLSCSLSIRRQPISGRREWSFVSFLRQPVIETYVYANNIEDVERGLYHYLPYAHMMEVLTKGGAPDLLRGAISEKERARLSAVLFLTVRYREVFKLKGHRAYRLALMEAGSAISRLITVAAALGLETTLFFDFRDSLLCDGLGIDCYGEFPVAVVGLNRCS